MREKSHSESVSAAERDAPGLSLLRLGFSIFSNGKSLWCDGVGSKNPLPFGACEMEELVEKGLAIRAKNGSWQCTACPECGCPTIPGFDCCSQPYL